MSTLRVCAGCSLDVGERRSGAALHVLTERGWLCGSTSKIEEVTEIEAVAIPQEAWDVVKAYLHALQVDTHWHRLNEGAPVEVSGTVGWRDVEDGLAEVIAIIDGY